ncbi:response regulator [Massilia sp. Root418]|uniref:response regulator n=1 Tax=Massilia sp. Root418 TaxID=1736532 RepID=UPI0009EA1FCB|nr:response regulator [Massilia sp. Root418]
MEITLPKPSKTANRQQRKAKRPQCGGGSSASSQSVQVRNPLSHTICVVDDDLAARSGMCNLIEAWGYHALFFDAGESFLASPQINEIDFAIFDIKLRGMDGFAVQQQCSLLGLELPVIFISGHGDVDLERRAVAAGALALLPKPVDPELLRVYIEDRLGRQGGRS